MYDFFYNVVIKYYPKAKLLYMDTDSFIIEFPDNLEGFSKFVIKNREHFGLSGSTMLTSHCIITYKK